MEGLKDMLLDFWSFRSVEFYAAGWRIFIKILLT